MEKKQRVPKGEMYFYINEVCHISDWKDTGGSFSAMRFLLGNYFHTKEEAESMARKLRAVLNGAEVIEMPSEEEIRRYANSVIYQPSDCNRHIHAYEVVAYARGVEKGVEYLKSKIVK